MARRRLLSLDDAITMFHEFGHALHGMLTKAKYPSQSGTRVRRDNVELPSSFLTLSDRTRDHEGAFTPYQNRHTDADDMIFAHRSQSQYGQRL